MKLIKCSKCGKTIDIGCVFCPQCGEKINSKEAVHISVLKRSPVGTGPIVSTVLFGVFLTIFAILAVVFFSVATEMSPNWAWNTFGGIFTGFHIIFTICFTQSLVRNAKNATRSAVPLITYDSDSDEFTLYRLWGNPVQVKRKDLLYISCHFTSANCTCACVRVGPENKLYWLGWAENYSEFKTWLKTAN